jgi:hypothetical protein
LIYSSTGDHLGRFQYFAFLNNASKNKNLKMYDFEGVQENRQDKFPATGLLIQRASTFVTLYSQTHTMLYPNSNL